MLELNSVTRLVELLKNPQNGYIKELAFGCISNTEKFMEYGGSLYQGEITIDYSCYDVLTNQSTDEEVADALDKAILYDWHLQHLNTNIDKEEWVGFWRRYNLLQFFSNSSASKVENTTININRDEIKMYYPGLEDIVDILLDNCIVFGLEGDSDLTDSDGIVLASAGMIIRDSMIAIDPIDENSATIFTAAGYKIMDSNNFNINDIKKL
jgi:DEAD/DEAH box helicase domain-containing protein